MTLCEMGCYSEQASYYFWPMSAPDSVCVQCSRPLSTTPPSDICSSKHQQRPPLPCYNISFQALCPLLHLSSVFVLIYFFAGLAIAVRCVKCNANIPDVANN